MQQQTELTEARAETLTYLTESGGTVHGYNTIAEARDVGHEAQRRLCNRMEDDGLLELSPHPNGTIIDLTDTGKDLGIELTYGRLDVGTESGSGEKRMTRRLHGLVVHCSITDGSMLDSKFDYRSRIKERDDLDFVRVEEFREETDVVIGYRKRWLMRFHRDSVTLQMKAGESIEKFSTAACFREATERIRQALRWLRQMTGVQDWSVDDVLIGRAELAFERHHLALLADSLDGLKLSDIVVEDPDGEGTPEIWMDSSVVPETETGNGGRAEEIGNRIEAELRQFGHYPDAIRVRHSLERELAVQGVDPVAAAGFIADGAEEFEPDGDGGAGGTDDDIDTGTGGDVGDGYDYEEWNQLDRWRE